ncbi:MULTISPECIES: restriction endonuclease subunit S [Citricoccus]|uniref:Restriction endonuclease subunit S n=1 Tax=Citricoccus muralis TaxID=169134 RepID=A0ABY8H5W3_9MICC|nr:MULTISPECIES: restriction endonuclease subunit S [Citricoccus]WBL19935.1 restriction endonuclease subunit S [Citricoccus sp. NR2]WFP16520.1 restriction endonuclease subunit S [Citricoccus muralis]
MKTVVLGDLIRPAGRKAGADTNFPVYSVTKHSGFVPSLEYFKKQVFSREVTGYKLVEPGDFAYATIHLDEGSIGIAPERGLISPMYTVFSADGSRVDSNYLIRFLKSPRALAHYPQLGKGAIHRRKSISLSALGNLPIPLPSIPEQQRIAALLDRADAIRTKRRQVLAHLDSLTQSIFHDMFGHPFSNERHFPKESIGSLATVETGNSPSRASAENFGNAIEWIKSDNLGNVIATRAIEGLSETGMRRARIAPAGSILVTCIAGSALSIGKASIVDRPVAFNQQINAILPSDSIDAMFLLGQLKTFPELVRGRSTGGMKGLVNKSAFASIEVLVPPRKTQRIYAQRMQVLIGLRQATLHALTADDDLFASLQSRAFRGDL